MATLGTVGNLLGAALKGSVNASIDQYRERRAEAQGKVDWEEYNYPPWINVLHYNVDDVEDAPARLAVKIAHVNYVCVASTFLVNLLGVIILAGGGAVDGVNVVYSLFNAVIYAIVGMYAFYNGYKGLATRNGRLTDHYVWLQACFLVFMFAASVASGANYNGWANVARARRSRRLPDFWAGWSCFEASLWTANYLVGGVALYKVTTNRKDAIRGGEGLGAFRL
jgi:hypothetical protein